MVRIWQENNMKNHEIIEKQAEMSSELQEATQILLQILCRNISVNALKIDFPYLQTI